MSSQRQRLRRENHLSISYYAMASRSKSAFPTSVKTQPVSQRVLRFVNDGNNTVSVIYRECMLSLMGSSSLATANTLHTPIFHNIRVTKVQIWGSETTTTALQLSPVILKWVSARGPDTEITDYGTSSHPPHVVSTPPKNSLCGEWSTAGSFESEPLFSISSGIGSVVDVHVEYVLLDGTAVKFLTTSVTTTRGLYYAPLDCLNGAAAIGNSQYLPSANSQFLPVSRT